MTPNPTPKPHDRPGDRSVADLPVTVDDWVAAAVDRSTARRTLRALDTGERIVAAVVDLLKEQGASFSLDEALRLAGVSRRTFYRHFASKDDVVLAALEVTVMSRVERQRSMLDEFGGDPIKQLHAVLQVRWRFPESESVTLARVRTTEYPKLAALLPTAWAESVTVANSATVEAIRNCRQAGLLRPSDLSDERIANLIGNLVSSLLSARVLRLTDDHRTVPPDEQGFADLWSFVSLLLVERPPSAPTA